MKTETYMVIGCGVAVVGIVVFYVQLNRKKDTMMLPLAGAITSPFGDRIHPITGAKDFHNGIDIKGATGDKILAPYNGIVASRYYNDAGGNQLVINHDNGYSTGYAHLSKYYVSAGDRVVKGQVIAEVGNTGNSTGSHLHLTLKDAGGNYINPINHFV